MFNRFKAGQIRIWVDQEGKEIGSRYRQEKKGGCENLRRELVPTLIKEEAQITSS